MPAESSPARNVVAGTATRYVLLALNIGLALVLTPFTIHHLGTAEYGLWMLVASLTYYFQLLDLGYGSGLVRHISAADARNDIDGVNAVLSTFVVVYAGLGILAAAGILVLIFTVVPRFPHLSASDIRQGQLLLAIIGVRTVVGFPMTVFGAVTTAKQRFALNNSVAIVVALINGIVTYAVLASGHGLVTLVAGTTAVGLASYAGYAWTARHAFPQLRIHPSAFDRSLVREVTTFSIYVFIIDVAVQIGFNLDNVVVGAVLGTSAVAVYAVSLRIADYQRQLCNQFNGLLFPLAVRFGAGGRFAELEHMMLEGTRIALIMVTGVTICVIGLGGPLIAAWMGPTFREGVVPLYVLALIGIVLVGQGPLGNILLGTDHHRLVAYSALGEAIANLILSLLLVRRFGMLGVAIGTAVPIAIVNGFILLPAACRMLGYRPLAFLRLVFSAPARGAVPAIVACIAMRLAWPPTSLAAVMIEGALVYLVYAASVWAFGVSRGVRASYTQQGRVLLASLRPTAHAVAGGAS
ncbi:MAG TPA: oligosaccharide flippase family protein [Vicinamibacterales bacterium]|jgi:O-antigen/teichoic acid export membrane protein